MTAATRLLVVSAALLVLPAVTHAHFRLMEPASWIVENDLGDPQKAGPCGGTNTDYGKPTYAVTQAVGGRTLHIKVIETIYHPGHYRVALAVNSPLETDVTLPNISCKKCTLQVVQFMEQHGPNNPGNYTYHHCANIQITADPKKPIDAAWPKER